VALPVEFRAVAKTEPHQRLHGSRHVERSVAASLHECGCAVCVARDGYACHDHRRIASAPAQCDAFLRHAVFTVTSAVPPGGPDAHRCLPDVQSKHFICRIRSEAACVRPRSTSRSPKGNNRFGICQLTSKGVHIMHKPGVRTEDSVNAWNAASCTRACTQSGLDPMTRSICDAK